LRIYLNTFIFEPVR